MSSKKYAAPLQLEVKSSLFLLFIFLALHLLALMIVFVLAFNVTLSIFIVLLILISAYFTITEQALKKTSGAVVNLVWDAHNDWYLTSRSGEEIKAKLLGDSFMHPFITILNFKQSPNQELNNLDKPARLNRFNPATIWQNVVGLTVILLKGNINKNDFRRLRVRLKISKLDE